MTPTERNLEPMAASPLPVLPEVRMNVVRPKEPIVARVVSNEICTASRKAAGFVRHIEFDVTGTPLAGSFRSGQAFGVIPPGVDERGKPHQVRLYSLACPTAGEDGHGNIVSTTVKRTIDEHWSDHRLFLGVASNYLCDLKPGDEALLSGPNGKRFLLPTDAAQHDYLFLATGTGVAPFRGMVRDLLALGAEGSITLVMGAPYRTDLIYHDEFLALAAAHSNFTYMTAISRERDDDGRSGMYVHERLLHERDRLIPSLASGRSLVYICGIAGMELGVYRALAECLPGAGLEPYIECASELLADPRSWTRDHLRKEIRPTERLFVEVY